MRIVRETVERFRQYLLERECAGATVTKYMHDAGVLVGFCGGRIEDKSTLISFKEHLQEGGMRRPASIPCWRR